jgi:hypothetical protein
VSINLDVFLNRRNLPDRESWQRAIIAAGVDFEFDDAEPATHNGFWPCKLDGKECGFEYFFGDREPIEERERAAQAKRGWWSRLFGSSDPVKVVEHDEFDDLQEAIGDRDSMVSFKWRGAHKQAELDGRAAMLAAATLAKIADGVFVDPQGDFATGADALDLIEVEDG